MKIWYLAHPVRGDSQFSCDENLAHVLTTQRILHEKGIFTVNPWFTWVRIYGASPGKMEGAMEFNREILNCCEGVILTGHKVSHGMLEEIEDISPDKIILNLVGIPSSMIGYFFDHMESRSF